MTAQANRAHVFYTDPKNGWAAMQIDQNEFQVGQADYSYLKSDAIKTAIGYGLEVRVFGRNGLEQRTIARKEKA